MDWQCKGRVKSILADVSDGLACNYCHKCNILTGCRHNPNVRNATCVYLRRIILLVSIMLEVFYTRSYIKKTTVCGVREVFPYFYWGSGMDCPRAPSCGAQVECNLCSPLQPLSAPVSSQYPAAALLLYFNIPSSFSLSEMARHFLFLSHRASAYTPSWRDLSDLLVKYLDGRFELL